MSVAAQLTQFVTQYGYLAVAAAVFAENLGLPVPGETAVFIASAAAAAGHLNVIAVWLVAFTAAVVGDNAGFAIGHFGGKPLFLRFGPRIGISHETYASTERFFDRFGGPAVLVARFLPVMRVVAAITAGVSGMQWRRFSPWQALGAALWAAYATTVGYFGNRAVVFFKPMLIQEFGKWWPAVIVLIVVLSFAIVAEVSRVLAHRAMKQG